MLTACNQTNRPVSKNEMQTMTREHQDSIRQFMHHYVEEIWNKRDLQKADEYWERTSKMFLLRNLNMDRKE